MSDAVALLFCPHWQGFCDGENALKLSRDRFPREPANLDYYVNKFDIKTDEKETRGTIVDATITALVFKKCFSITSDI